MVSTAIKRSSLDDAFDASVLAANTLRQQLRAYETAARAAISSGQVISAVSASNGAGGRSTSFSQPSKEAFEGLNPVSLVEMWRALVDLHDLVIEQESLSNSTNDREAIKDAMMALLKPCTEHTMDFSRLRCPPVTEAA